MKLRGSEIGICEEIRTLSIQRSSIYAVAEMALRGDDDVFTTLQVLEVPSSADVWAPGRDLSELVVRDMNPSGTSASEPRDVLLFPLIPSCDVNDAASWREACNNAASHAAQGAAVLCALASIHFIDFQCASSLSINAMDLYAVVQDHAQLRIDLALRANHCKGSVHQWATNVPLPLGSQRRHLPNERLPEDRMVPVLVGSVPELRKGSLQLSRSHLLPFSDAEIFQLFYQQLLLRMIFDAQWELKDTDGALKGDALFVNHGGSQGLAFEDPESPDTWLLFPSGSNILSVSPHVKMVFRGASEVQPLSGALVLPAVTRFGKYVVAQWATKVQLRSPGDARIALLSLMEIFRPLYGASRQTVMECTVPPKVHRCGAASLKRLRQQFPSLRSLLTSVTAPAVTCSDWAEASGKALQSQWRAYISTGDTTLFDGTMNDIRIVRLLGRGGSGMVFEAEHVPSKTPVAVKCFICLDRATHHEYVVESLTDLAFFVLLNQVDDFELGLCCRAFQFTITDVPPQGMSPDDAAVCRRHREENRKLCFLVTDVMEGTLGKFLAPGDAEYDAGYDTIVNSVLSDGEVFQLVYMQLLLRELCNYTILDLMLHGQLRGDNIGWLSLCDSRNPRFSKCKALVYEFDDDTGSSKYIEFPASCTRGLFFIDVGQGIQDSVIRLTARGLIGKTVVDSCVEDDGMGRYWPLEKRAADDFCLTVENPS